MLYLTLNTIMMSCICHWWWSKLYVEVWTTLCTSLTQLVLCFAVSVGVNCPLFLSFSVVFYALEVWTGCCFFYRVYLLLNEWLYASQIVYRIQYVFCHAECQCNITYLSHQTYLVGFLPGIQQISLKHPSVAVFL